MCNNDWLSTVSVNNMVDVADDICVIIFVKENFTLLEISLDFISWCLFEKVSVKTYINALYKVGNKQLPDSTTTILSN